MTSKLEQARVKLTVVREAVAKHPASSSYTATSLTLDEIDALLAAAHADGVRAGVRDAQRAISAVGTYTKTVLAVDDLRIRLKS